MVASMPHIWLGRSVEDGSLMALLLDWLPLRPPYGPGWVGLRAPSAGPETETFTLDICHSLYRKSVSNEIVLRESGYRLWLAENRGFGTLATWKAAAFPSYGLPRTAALVHYKR